jgi:ferredoxin
MKRNIITIDAKKCTGCGVCIPNCPEGAIQIIDNKARLIGDLFCDGLGACLGHCPEGAISIEQREAGEYSEVEVMKNIVKQGPNVIAAHLEHLRSHHQDAYVQEAIDYLKANNIPVPQNGEKAGQHQGGEKAGHEPHGCPGSRARTMQRNIGDAPSIGSMPSRLGQWPVQLHLVSPHADYFRSSDVVLCADCVAYALGDFHEKWLKGNTLAIACPKLDEGKEEYIKKLTALIDNANINTMTVMTMEVPCCSGLLRLAEEALAAASRKIPVKSVVVGIEGDIKSEQWL